jgi:hypothetical protein
MYANAPPEVEAIKSMLLLCSTWTGLSGTIHYPSASAGNSASPDAPPFIVIEPVKNTPKVIAPGLVMPGGTIQLILVMVDSTGQDIEKKARAICDELGLVPTGLPITSTDVGMCSEPDAGARASQEYSDENTLSQANAIRSIPIIITFGLT